MRWVILFLALTLLALQLEFWFGEDRRPGLMQAKQDVAAQSEWNRTLVERNADLEAEIRNLKQGVEAAEERARAELGLVLPTEDFFQFAR
jgi:cell division protein FtsB